MFDLQGYLEKIDLNSVEATCDYAGLCLVLKNHIYTFYSSNAVLYSEGKKPKKKRKVATIDPSEILASAATKIQSLYCYQHVELLYAALDALGFSVGRLQAWVMNKPLTQLLTQEILHEIPPTHGMLQVSIGEEKYLLDAGYGSNSLCAPLPLVLDEDQVASELHYRLTALTPTEWRLDLLSAPEPLALYQFPVEVCTKEAFFSLNDQLFLSDQVIPVRDRFYHLSKITPTERTRLLHFKEGESLRVTSVRREESEGGLMHLKQKKALPYRDSFFKEAVVHFSEKPPSTLLAEMRTPYPRRCAK